MNKLQVEENDLKILKSILKNKKIKIFVFGSRVKGNAKKFSDLDLVIKSKLNELELLKLKEEFEDSNLSFKVDIIMWDQISGDFRKNIENDLQSLYLMV